MHTIPELLSPAGDWDSFVAAVENGSDAVYMGGTEFSARQYASNFSVDDLEKALRYAHLRGVRLYITVNTMVAQEELADALRFLHRLNTIGVDAVIVQDLGLLRLTRKLLPTLEVHASTQMTVHSTPACALLEGLGVRRVVLAREMSLLEIGAIDRATSVELEAFVHGALCICYSGQCLMSSLIGGRSGNRGRCAQPCRLEYEATELDAEWRPLHRAGAVVAAEAPLEGHLLSPKDLNASAVLRELLDAGVDSLKIEGRMKRPEYVATVTRVYRQILDRALAGPSDQPTPVEESELLQVFNRGVTTAYLSANPGSDLMSYKRPSNRGKYLGRVEGYDRASGHVTLMLEDSLSIGDGIEVWVSQGGRAAAEVRAMSVGGEAVDLARRGQRAVVEVTGKIRSGDRCFKTRDAGLMAKAQGTFRSSRTSRKVGIRGRVSGQTGCPLTIRFEDEPGNSGASSTSVALVMAEKRPLTREFLLEQLSRLGNTPYELVDLDVDLPDGLIVPVSHINEARRRALSSLDESRLARASRTSVASQSREDFEVGLKMELCGPIRSRSEASMGISVVVDTIECARRACQDGADMVLLNLGAPAFAALHGVLSTELGELAFEYGTRLGVMTPRVMKDMDLAEVWADIESLSDHAELAEVWVGNLGAVREWSRRRAGLPICLDHPLGTYNPQALRLLQEECDALVSRVVCASASVELTLAQLRQFVAASPVPIEALAHGTLTMMVSEHCFVGSISGSGKRLDCSGACRRGRYGLRDLTGSVFPIYTDRFCRGFIANSRDLCTIEHLREFREAGVSRLRVDGTARSADYVGGAVRAYRSELVRLDEDPQGYRPSQELRERLERATPYGITKGHYFRGVTDPR